MSNRTEKLLAAVWPEMDTKLKQTLLQIGEEYTAHRKQIFTRFEKSFVQGVKKAQDAQPNKGKIKFIQISYLLSSLLNKRCEFRFDFYNNNLYLDEIEAECYWQADFITPRFDADYSYFQGLLKKSLIRVMDYEAAQMTTSFGALYYSALSFYWAEMLADISLKEYENLFEDEVQVLYGGFQDKSVCVGKLRLGEDGICVISL